jgi:hypothetical protein
MVRERPDLSAVAASERDLLAAAAAVLRGVGSLLAGGKRRPDIAKLERALEGSLAHVDSLRPDEPGYAAAARVCFHAEMIAVAVSSVAGDAIVAARLAGPAWLEQERRRRYLGSASSQLARRRVSATARVVRQHATVRSVWVVTSLRGAVALALAVAVADVTTVQHGFWVVLGTLSVLRSNAVSTGATALRALLGTVIGFIIGGALLVAIGAASGVLWVVLPAAVLVAAYSAGTMPFAVGQAAFTITVAVIFNLLVPAGWQVGVVRIEDVALGCAVSAVVGVVFWPRGLASVVGDDLADAYRAGAHYLRQAVRWVANAQTDPPAGADAALSSGRRLDEALRGFLAEQGGKHIELPELWRLVGGAMRLRLTAYSIAALSQDSTLAGSSQDALLRRAGTLAAWFERLAAMVGRRPQAALQTGPAFGPDEVVDASSGSHYAVWLCEHLDHLAEHLSELLAPANLLAQARRRPWWR